MTICLKKDFLLNKIKKKKKPKTKEEKSFFNKYSFKLCLM
jgi:hypothetical protein